MPTLSLLDNADGSGITLTVDGFGAGRMLNVFTSVPGLDWSFASFVVGDGIHTIPVAPGLVSVYVAADDDATLFTPPRTVYATDPEEAVATRCRRAVGQVIAGLALPLVGSNIVEGIFPDDTAVQYPVCHLSVEALTETVQVVVTELNDIGYPVQVMYADNNHMLWHSRLRVYEVWRERTIAAFEGKHLEGVPESMYCAVEPMMIADPKLPQYQHMVTGMVVRCFTRHN